MENLLGYLDKNGDMKDLLGTVKLFVSNSMTKWPQTTSTVFKVVQKFLSKVCMSLFTKYVDNWQYKDTHFRFTSVDQSSSSIYHFRSLSFPFLFFSTSITGQS